MNIEFAFALLLLMILIYSYLIFELVDTLLERPRLKKMYRFGVGIINVLFLGTLTIFCGNRTSLSYIAVGIVLFTEFSLFYRDKHLRSLFCTLACTIHIMAARSLCVSFFAIFFDQSIFQVVTDPFLLISSTYVTFFFLNIVIFLVIRFVPAQGVRIINQHEEQLWFMVVWLMIFNIYFFINAQVYHDPNDHPALLLNQILSPIASLLGTYVVLFYAMKTSTLLGYKEKSQELQLTIEKERLYRLTMDKDVFRIIEVNYSQNLLISGFEDFEEKLGDVTHNYEKMLAFMIQATVHPEDANEFLRYSSPQTVIDVFEQGKDEIVFEFRRLMPDGEYVWMQVLMAMIREGNSGDVTGFVQLKNIDTEKKRQLELEYKAERDLLTSLYNKATTEKRIREYLQSQEQHAPAGVLFVLDIDNFKTINDRLGHLYGDAVLSELSEKLKLIFREDDIVGRIGGDEFLVFAKGELGEKMITKKANAICHDFFRTYENERGESYHVSSSIGISISPQDGTDFETLFKYADAALFTTKAKGKNGFSFCDKAQEMSYVSTRTEIDTHDSLQKNFRDNRVEYVFRLLYGSEDTKSSILSVLELICKNFGFSRANIFEFNEKSTHFSGVFEWCAQDIPSVIHLYVDLPLDDYDFAISTLGTTGDMFCAVPEDIPEYIREAYTSLDIKYIIHFAIREGEKMIGVLAFQHCLNDDFRVPEEELEELRTICQVLSIFMSKQLSKEREKRHHTAIEAVMDNMNSIAYVVDRETFEVFYENQNVVNITGCSSIGKKCYRSYRGLDAPCPDCSLNLLSEENPRCVQEVYTEKFDLYTQTSGALIDWSNDRKALLLSSIDITEYKRQEKKET